MKNETTVKPTVVLRKPDPSPLTEKPDKSEFTKPGTKSTKTTQALPETPMPANTSKLPRRITTPRSVLTQEEVALPLLLETPPDSTRKKRQPKSKNTHEGQVTKQSTLGTLLNRTNHFLEHTRDMKERDTLYCHHI